MLRILERLQVVFEKDKGYIPSGYAQLSISLTPYDGDDNLFTTSNLDKNWTVRATTDSAKYYGEIKQNEIDEFISSFLQMVSNGVTKGANDALSHSLQEPVIGVVISIDQATFDLVFSTEASFEVAAREAVALLLRQAGSKGKIKRIK